MRRSLIGIAAFLFLALPFFQNCSEFIDLGHAPATPESIRKISFASACDSELFAEFIRGYHPFLRRIGCDHCHSPEGMKADAPFAQRDQLAAFLSFKPRGPTKINSRFSEGHQREILGYDITNPALASELENYLTGWNKIQNNCGLAAKSVLTEGLPAQIFLSKDPGDLSKCGLGNPLKQNHLEFQTVTWDLSALRPDLAGVQISISVKANIPLLIGSNICSHQGYRAGDVKVTSSKALSIKNVHILLNDKNFDVNTFLIERQVPASSKDYKLIDSQSGGFAIFDSGTCKALDIWKLAIEAVEVVK